MGSNTSAAQNTAKALPAVTTRSCLPTQADFRDLFLHVNSWMNHCSDTNQSLFID
eukprot:GSA25T00007646001.1